MKIKGTLKTWLLPFFVVACWVIVRMIGVIRTNRENVNPREMLPLQSDGICLSLLMLALFVRDSIHLSSGVIFHRM